MMFDHSTLTYLGYVSTSQHKYTSILHQFFVPSFSQLASVASFKYSDWYPTRYNFTCGIIFLDDLSVLIIFTMSHTWIIIGFGAGFGSVI